MKSFEDSFPIVLLRQYHFCPRIVWYQTYRDIKSKETIWMRQGSEYHKHREILLKKKILNKFPKENTKIEYRTNVQSEKYFIHGIVDAVIVSENEVCPIEFKLNKFSKTKGTINQLFGYGLCLEEMYQKEFKRAYIVGGKNPKLIEINFELEDRDSLLKTIDGVRRVMETSYLPESSASVSKCAQCEYLNFCNDREI